MSRSPRQFERVLRPRVREKLRASPALWEEFKRLRRGRLRGKLLIGAYQLLLFVAGGPILFLAAPLMMCMIFKETTGIEGLLANLGWWSLAAAVLYAALLQFELGQLRSRSYLPFLPVADGEIARSCWRNVTAISAAWIYLAAIANGFLAWSERLSLGGWVVALCCCVAHWFTVVAVGTAFAVRFQQGINWRVAFYVTAIPWGLIMVAMRHDTMVLVLLFTTPGGWIGTAWWLGLHGVHAGWLCLVPLAVLLARCPAWRRRLIESYTAAEYVEVVDAPRRTRPKHGRLLAKWFTDWITWLSGNWPEAEPAPLRPEEACARIRTRAFLGAQEWPWSGWLERAADNLLSKRDRDAVSMLSIGSPHWTDGAKWLLCFGIILSVVSRLPPFAAQGGLFFVYWILMISVCVVAVPPFDRRLNRESPMVPAALPIAPRDFLRVLFRLALGRWLIALPVVALGVLTVPQLPPQRGLLALVAIDVSCALICIEFLRAASIVVRAWSLPKLRWLTCYWLLAPVAWLIAVVIGANLMLFVNVWCAAQGPPLPWAAIGFAWVWSVATAAVAWRFCVFIQQSGRCDLTRMRGSTVTENLVVSSAKQQVRRRRRSAQRRQLGPFWWLPRHVPAADQGPQP